MLRTIILLPDGAEISSGTGSTIAIQKSTLTECVNSENELTIGSVCANQFKATLFTPKGNLDIEAGTEVLILKEDDNGQRYPVGRFILDKPTRATANTFSVTGYDRVSKLDKDLAAWLSGLAGWPYSLNAFAIEVCKACGVPLKETDVPNKDFQIQKFTRTAVTGRQLMRWLGEICCSFCRADREGYIEFAWYSNREIEIRPTGDRYYFQNGLTFENYEVAKVDAVQLRLADSENGALWPAAAEGANSYIITGNPILNARITEELLPYLQVIQNRLFGATYTPCKVEIPASMDISAGDIIKITDKNGKSFNTWIMTKTQSGQKDTLESTGSVRRDSTAAVNNKSQQDAVKQVLDNQTWQELFSKWTDGGKIQGVFAENGVWIINAAAAVIRNLAADVITAGRLWSKDRKTYIDLDTGEIVSDSGAGYDMRISAGQILITTPTSDSGTRKVIGTISFDITNDGKDCSPLLLLNQIKDGNVLSTVQILDGSVKVHDPNGHMCLIGVTENGARIYTDNIQPSGNGNCQWEYIPSIGKTVLVQQ